MESERNQNPTQKYLFLSLGNFFSTCWEQMKKLHKSRQSQTSDGQTESKNGLREAEND